MTRQSVRIRSFIAIPVPDCGIRVLQDAVGRLDLELGKTVRWVRPEGIHLTLKFMGDIEPEIVERVLEALPPAAARFSPFELAISGLGVFPNAQRPRVLWAGVQGGIETLSRLQQAVDDAVENIGLPKEDRRFSPHLTLGRVRREVSGGQLRKIGDVMTARELPESPSWTADTVNLMRTEPDPSGSRHYLVGSARIGGG